MRRMAPADAERMARGVRVHLMTLFRIEVSRLEQSGAQ
jgi:hypothetical protein